MGATPTCVQIFFRSFPDAPSTLCIPGDTVCVCVCLCLCLCVFGIACSPHPTLHPPDVRSSLILLVGGNADMCQVCVRSLPDAPSTLCIMGDTVCVCVCVFGIACSPHPTLHPPDVHSPLILLMGGPCLYVSRLRLILARGSIHPVYHEIHGVCACVCVCYCLLPPPPMRPPDVHSPLI